MTNRRPTRILILGGGHAGVPVARRLVKQRRPQDNLEIAMVSQDQFEVWHGLLPQVVSGLVQPVNALVPLREMLPGITIYPYQLKAIDLVNRCVVTSPGDERDDVVLGYDYLVLALGSVTDMSRFSGLVEHGLQTKTIGDIVHLRNHLIAMLERASVEQDPAERQRMLSVVIAGAGFAGAEIASQANEFLRTALRFYPSITPSDLRVMLVGSGKRIMPALSERLADRALRYMQRNNIEVRLGVGVNAVTATTAELSTGECIPTRTVVVTVGVAPNPLATGLPVNLVQQRIKCDAFCRVEGWPGVYAAGDNAAIPDPRTGAPCPPTFLYAFTQGQRIADNLLAELRDQPLRRYRYRSIGELAFLSKRYAVGTFKGIPLSGMVVTLLGRGFYLAYTPTWRRRTTLLLDWLASTVLPRDITEVPTARSDTIVPMRFGPGEVIIREGEPGSRFYVISEGEVEVVRRLPAGREEVLERLGPGRYFGEIALLHAVKRTATIRATTHTKVLSIARQEFGSLVSHLPALRDAIHERARFSQAKLAMLQPTGRSEIEPHGDVDQPQIL